MKKLFTILFLAGSLSAAAQKDSTIKRDSVQQPQPFILQGSYQAFQSLLYVIQNPHKASATDAAIVRDWIIEQINQQLDLRKKNQ